MEIYLKTRDAAFHHVYACACVLVDTAVGQRDGRVQVPVVFVLVWQVFVLVWQVFVLV